MTATIYIGDAVQQLAGLEDDTIQCVVTSPPYDKLRTYEHDREWDFEKTANELYRVIMGGGNCLLEYRRQCHQRIGDTDERKTENIFCGRMRV